MFKLQRSLFVLLAMAMLFAANSSASQTYECDGLYHTKGYGWLPQKFSITAEYGEVTQIKSDRYMYDLDKLRVREASRQLIWATYKSSEKTGSGSQINVRHIIKVYPIKQKIIYEMFFPGGWRVKGEGFCG